MVVITVTQQGDLTAPHLDQPARVLFDLLLLGYFHEGSHLVL